MTHYHLEAHAHGDPRVELWSTERLPFEPKGWKRDMRDQLRDAIRRSTPMDPCLILEAVYTSQDHGFCDVENVLVYNPGPSTFHHLCRTGLRLERRFEDPPPAPRPLSTPPFHHHLYTSTHDEMSSYWVEDSLLAEWSFSTEPLVGEIKPDSIWMAAARGQVTRTAEMGTARTRPAQFGLRLMIERPSGASILLANVLKPLLDGLLCALHTHDGSNLDEISRRLSTRLDEDQDTIRRTLLSTDRDVLGERQLVRPYRQGVQWNPADDLCVLADVRTRGGAEWRCAGRIFTVRRR